MMPSETKPGAVSSEFWQTGLAMIASVLTGALAEDWRVQSVGLICMTTIVIVYAWSRTRVKQNGG